jgi:hypothetical protein
MLFLAGDAADLFDRIASDAAFGLTRPDLVEVARPERLVGRAPEQVDAFVAEELDPALAGAAACTRQPAEHIVPYVRQPEEIVPGRRV